MADNSFDAICEVEFVDAQSGQRVVTRLGPPKFDPAQNGFFCLSEIVGVEQGKIQRVNGVDPFQAISVSIKRFRVVFTSLSGDFRSSTGDPPQIVFPKEIPWVYGSDVYERLCKMVDDEVQKIEDERTRRREGTNRKDDS